MRLLKECYAHELPVNATFLFEGVSFKLKEKDGAILGCDVIHDPYSFWNKGERKQLSANLVVITEIGD